MSRHYPLLGGDVPPGEHFRNWWTYASPIYRYLCPEGSAVPYRPTYTSHSTFGRVFAPLIRHLLFPYRFNITTELAWRDLHGSIVLPRRLLTHPSFYEFEITLHTPTDLSQGRHHFTDRSRFHLSASHLLSPRITIVPKLAAPDLDFVPLKGPYEVPRYIQDAAYAEACSLRARIALSSTPLSFLMWDVGLFQPSHDDQEKGFGSGTLPARLLASITALEPDCFTSRSHAKQIGLWGAMLLVNPCEHLMPDIYSMHFSLGYYLPFMGLIHGAENAIAQLYADSLKDAPKKLIELLEKEASFWIPAVSRTGIRILSEEDYPLYRPYKPPDLIVPICDRWPLIGVEITLPVGAKMPSHSFYEYGPYIFTDDRLVHPVLMQSHGTSLAWLADMIEFMLMRGGFITIFRSFQLDERGFRVKLYLLYRAVHSAEGSLTKSICDHPRTIRDSGDNPDARDPAASNLHFPSRERLPYLFPCTWSPISQWPDTQDVIDHREAYNRRYPSVLIPHVGFSPEEQQQAAALDLIQANAGFPPLAHIID